MCLRSKIIILDKNYLWLAVEKYIPEKNEGQKLHKGICSLYNTVIAHIEQ